MRYLTITDDSTPEEFREAIGHLRSRQVLCTDAAVRLELGSDIDDLVDRLLRAERCGS